MMFEFDYLSKLSDQEYCTVIMTVAEHAMHTPDALDPECTVLSAIYSSATSVKSSDIMT